MASFLDLFTATDTDGVSAARYRLHFAGGLLSNQESWIFGMLTDLVYAAFQLLVIPANALWGVIVNTGPWLGQLSSFYRSLAAPLFAVFPPWAIACFGLALVAVSILMSRRAGSQAANAHGGGRPAARPGSDALNRAGGALAMVAMVVVLTSDPFALMAKLLELANSFAAGLSARISGDGTVAALAGQPLVDVSIRTPTLVLNYGHTLTGDCLRGWSEAMLAGQPFSGKDAAGGACLSPGDDTAGASTLATALLMLVLPALPMLVFCLAAVWKYVLHLSMAVLHLLVSGWVAAVSVHRRRGFERLVKTFARAAAHLGLAVIVSMLTVALPVMCAELLVRLFGLTGAEAGPYAQMLALGVGFAVSAWVIGKVTASHGALVRVLRANPHANLETLFGLSPGTFSFRFSDLTAKFRGGGEDGDAAGGKAARGRKSRLAADPIAATARSAPGDGDAKTPDTGSAVGALLAAAQSVATTSPLAAAAAATAAAAADVPGPAPGIVSGGADTPASDTAVVITTVPPPPPPGGESATVPAAAAVDRHGFFTAPSGEDVTSAEPEGAAVSALAAPPPRALPTDGASAPAVPGLRGANPELETVAARTGAVFAPAAPPVPSRRLSNLLRRFRPGPVIPAPAGAVPEVVYGPPLAAVTGLAGKVRHAVAGAAEAAAQRLRNRRETTAATPVALADPCSFVAPLPDFLAGDDTEAQLELVRIVAAAAGRAVTVEIDPADSRVGLALSSDPEQRVRPSGGSGFGDPIG